MKNLKLGLLILFLLGFIGWILSGMIEFIDKVFRSFLHLFLPQNLIFTGSGIILALILSYLLGKFLRSKTVEKHLGPILSHIPLVSKLWKFGKAAQMSLEELKTLPRVLIDYEGPGRADLAFLRDIEKMEIKNRKGEVVKTIVKAFVYLPSANNPTSGRISKVDPDTIVAVVENDFMEIMNCIVSCSAIKPAGGWQLREFILEEFLNFQNPTS